MRGGSGEISCRGNYFLAGPFKYDHFANKEVSLVSAIGRRGSEGPRQQQVFQADSRLLRHKCVSRAVLAGRSFFPRNIDKRKPKVTDPPLIAGANAQHGVNNSN